jgi:hypothetical protein
VARVVALGVAAGILLSSILVRRLILTTGIGLDAVIAAPSIVPLWPMGWRNHGRAAR